MQATTSLRSSAPVTGADILVRHRRRLRERQVKTVGLTLASLAAGVVLWILLGMLPNANLILAPIPEIGAAWSELLVGGRLIPPLLETGRSFLIGLLISLVVGIPVGLLMGQFRVVSSILGIFVNTMMSTPSAAFIPLLLLYFGVTETALVAFTVLFTLFTVIVNVEAGVHEVDPNLVEMARAMGSSEAQIFRLILLPGSMPMIMASVRLGIGRAVRGAVTGAVVMTLTGLGGLVDTFGHSFATAKLWAVILTIVGAAVVVTLAGQQFERRALGWQASRRAAASDGG